MAELTLTGLVSMPPYTRMSGSSAVVVSARPRNPATNFSIEAIMAEDKKAVGVGLDHRREREDDMGDEPEDDFDDHHEEEDDEDEEVDIEADDDLPPPISGRDDDEGRGGVGRTDGGHKPAVGVAAFAAATKEEDRKNSASAGVKKKERRPRVVEECNAPELEGVRCQLDNKELWDKFCEFGTEMIITRTGRRMFPTVRVTFSNLESLLQHHEQAGTKYLVLLDIVPCDNKRYRYAYHRSAWLVAGKADPAPPHRLYSHPDGPFSLDQIRKQVISFEKVKVTNNETDNTGQIILNSMHKFQPRVYLVKRKEGDTNRPVTDIHRESFRSFVFTETQFTAVTAYQNQLITKLKIESNPFAKGFRDSSSQDGDDPYPGYYGPGAMLPGGMPGLDPFVAFRGGGGPPLLPPGSLHPPPPPPGLTGDNNNHQLFDIADKARMLLLYNRGMHHPGLLPPPHSTAAGGGCGPGGGLARPPSSSSGPCLPPPPPPPPQELLARYSALQATMGSFYNPSLLAAALRTSVAASVVSHHSQSPPPPLSSSRSPPPASSPPSSIVLSSAPHPLLLPPHLSGQPKPSLSPPNSANPPGSSLIPDPVNLLKNGAARFSPYVVPLRKMESSPPVTPTSFHLTSSGESESAKSPSPPALRSSPMTSSPPSFAVERALELSGRR